METSALRQKYLLTNVILLALFILPLLATPWNSSQLVNLYAELIQLVFVLVMLSDNVKELVYLYVKSIYFRLIALTILVLYCGWFLSGIAIFEIFRTLHYPVYLLFFTAMVVWFKTHGESALMFIAKIKILLIVLVMLFMSYYIFYIIPPLNYIETDFFNYPPIYRHLRHMNYDVALALGFIIYLYCKELGNKKYFYLVLLFFCGFFTVWSAARAQTLSLLIFLSLLIYFRLGSNNAYKLASAVASFALGGACVFLTSYTAYISERNTIANSENVVNKLSSNRIKVWEGAFAKLQEEHAWLFGFGPDAWVRVNLFPGMSQPHNFILQWLFEFGLPVTVLLLVIMFKSVIFSLKLRNSSNDLTIEKMIAALMLSTFAYALVDGQFYHTIPFTMILIMAAYLFSQASSVRKTP